MTTPTRTGLARALVDEAAGRVRDALEAAGYREARRAGGRYSTARTPGFTLYSIFIVDEPAGVRMRIGNRPGGTFTGQLDAIDSYRAAILERLPDVDVERVVPPSERPYLTVFVHDDAGAELVHDRRPYVGEGPDGCRRSAQIDEEEAELLDLNDDRLAERAAELHASAARWRRQADRLDEREARAALARVGFAVGPPPESLAADDEVEADR